MAVKMLRKNNYRQSSSKQSGVTLIELLIAMGLGMVLVGAVVQLMMTNSANYQVQTAMSEVQQNALYSINYLTSEIRKAGYSGNTHKMEQVEIYRTSGATRVASRLVAGMMGTLENPANNLWRTRLGYYDPSSSQVPPIVFAGGEFGSDGATDTTASDTVAVQYLAQNGDTTCAGSPVVGNFVIVNTFFVRNGNLICRSYLPDGAGGAPMVESVLLEGVDNFQVQYGFDFERNTPESANYEAGIGGAEVYVNATQARTYIADAAMYAAQIKPNLVSVRIAVLLSSDLTDQLEAPGVSSYQVLDNQISDSTFINDGRYRRLYSTTIQLRNVPRSI